MLDRKRVGRGHSFRWWGDKRLLRPFVLTGLTICFCAPLVSGILCQVPLVSAGLWPENGTTITLNPSPATIVGCDTIQVQVKINDVSELYGADVRLSFDPSVLEVVDADAGTEGVQLEDGGWLGPGLFTALNEADNAAGTIKYAVTQLNPASPKTGSGVLAIIRLRGKSAGTSDVQFTDTKLADRNGNEIGATPVDGSVSTTGGPGSPTLSITRLDSTTARLSWSSISGVNEYHLYRDTAPYFAPVAPPYQSTTDLSYDDVGTLGNTSTNYFYVVRSSACDHGLESANSNRVGEFDFALVPGD